MIKEIYESVVISYVISLGGIHVYKYVLRLYGLRYEGRIIW